MPPLLSTSSAILDRDLPTQRLACQITVRDLSAVPLRRTPSLSETDFSDLDLRKEVCIDLEAVQRH